MIKSLVIDDAIEMLNGVKQLLTRSGFYCVNSQYGNKAISLLNDFNFDLIISDVFIRCMIVDIFIVLIITKHYHPIDITFPIMKK